MTDVACDSCLQGQLVKFFRWLKHHCEQLEPATFLNFLSPQDRNDAEEMSAHTALAESESSTDHKPQLAFSFHAHTLQKLSQHSGEFTSGDERQLAKEERRGQVSNKASFPAMEHQYQQLHDRDNYASCESRPWSPPLDVHITRHDARADANSRQCRATLATASSPRTSHLSESQRQRFDVFECCRISLFSCDNAAQLFSLVRVQLQCDGARKWAGHNRL